MRLFVLAALALSSAAGAQSSRDSARLQALVVGAVLGGIEEPRRVRQRRRWQEVFPSAPGSP